MGKYAKYMTYINLLPSTMSPEMLFTDDVDDDDDKDNGMTIQPSCIGCIWPNHPHIGPNLIWHTLQEK